MKFYLQVLIIQYSIIFLQTKQENNTTNTKTLLLQWQVILNKIL